MTSLTKTVRRSIPRNRLVIEVAPEGIYLREVGRRKRFGPIDYGRLYLQLVRAEVERVRAEKKAARKRR